MKVVFMGTPDFAVPSLEYLLKQHTVLAVVTQPDRQKGRGKRALPPIVKVRAQEAGIPVWQPEKVRTLAEDLRALQADVFVVVAFGQILPETVLSLPRYGCINVHGSLLPRYRGAAPIQWSLINGEATAGVTSMFMDKGMDTGDMLLRQEMPILAEDDYGSLAARLAVAGARVLAQTLEALEAGTLKRLPQDPALATYAPRLTQEMEHVDWTKDAVQIRNLLRGFSPTSGIYTVYQGEKLKLWATEPVEAANGRPGEVLAIDKHGFLVCCGRGGLWVREVQGQGGKRMAADAWLRGHALPAGQILE